MNTLKFLAIFASAFILSACQTTEIQNFLEEVGVIERPFNPDEVTITIMEMRKNLPNHVNELKTLQQGQLAIRNLQIKLEQLDRQIKQTRNANQKRSLLTSFNTTFNKRVLLQDRASELLERVNRSISKAAKKRKRLVSRIKAVLPRYSSKSNMRSKLKEQKSVLEGIGAYIANLTKVTSNTGKNLRSDV